VRTVIFIGLIFIAFSVRDAAQLPSLGSEILKILTWIVSVAIVMDLAEFFGGVKT
jgi:hypothetical protein